jgi:hypothetical protein
MTNLTVFAYIKKATGEIVGKLTTLGKLSRGNLIENASVIVMILMNQINATKRSKLPKSTNKG